MISRSARTSSGSQLPVAWQRALLEYSHQCVFGRLCVPFGFMGFRTDLRPQIRTLDVVIHGLCWSKKGPASSKTIHQSKIVPASVLRLLVSCLFARGLGFVSSISRPLNSRTITTTTEQNNLKIEPSRQTQSKIQRTVWRCWESHRTSKVQ